MRQTQRPETAAGVRADIIVPYLSVFFRGFRNLTKRNRFDIFFKTVPIERWLIIPRM